MKIIPPAMVAVILLICTWMIYYDTNVGVVTNPMGDKKPSIDELSEEYKNLWNLSKISKNDWLDSSAEVSRLEIKLGEANNADQSLATMKELMKAKANSDRYWKTYYDSLQRMEQIQKLFADGCKQD